MSRTLFDFLLDSGLLKQKHLDNEFSNIRDRTIQRELERYREFCIKQQQHIINSEITPVAGRLGVYGESGKLNFSEEIQRLRQSALYFQHYILDDPLFRFGYRGNQNIQPLNEYLGFSGKEFDKERFIQTCRFLRQCAPLVGGGYLKLLPNSYIHEPPKETPLTYSEVQYADALPEELMKFLHSKAKVMPMRQVKGGWQICPDEELKPCRAINIEFDKGPMTGFIYFLMHPELVTVDDESGKATLKQTLPDSPPGAGLFESWIYQSLNQSSADLYNHIFADASRAAATGSYLITRYSLVGELLDRELSQKETIQTITANKLLELELPYLDTVSTQRIMDIRSQDGAAFEAFRDGLEKKLKDLRTAKDAREHSIKLQNISHEITQVEVGDVQRKISGLKQKARVDAAKLSIALTGVFMPTLIGQAVSMLALANAAGDAFKIYGDFKRDISISPGYFMWRLKNNII